MDQNPSLSPEQTGLPKVESTVEAPQKRHGVSDTVGGYAETKTGDPRLQAEMIDRVVHVAREGAKAVHHDLDQMFAQDLLAQSQENVQENGPENEAEQGYPNNLAQEQLNILEGQPEKIDRMEGFVDDMTNWSAELVADFASKLEGVDTVSAEEKNKLINKYQESIQRVVIEATRLISYQDTKASAVSLGDHGWMHLTQDLRDAQTIATKKIGRELGAKEKFMLGLAAAYHDVGYAVPEVSDPQRLSKGNYGSLDKGHPVNSYVFAVAEKKNFEGVLGKAEADALFQMIANHENPEKAERAGEYAHLAEAFALADASAAFGKDKLPPIVVQIPEVLSYLNALTMADGKNFDPIFDQLEKSEIEQAAIDRVQELKALLESNQSGDGAITTETNQDQEVQAQLDKAQDHLEEMTKRAKKEAHQKYTAAVIKPLRDRVLASIDQKIKHAAEEAGDKTGTATDANGAEAGDKSAKMAELLHQAEAMKNAMEHFSPNSLKFLLGRMSAEALPIDVTPDKKVEFTINAGFAHQLESKGVISNTVDTSAKLTVKLFLEQAAITLNSRNPNELAMETALVEAVSKNTAPDQAALANLQAKGISIEVTGQPDRSVKLSSETVVIISKTDVGVSDENKAFYDQLETQLDQANKQAAAFILQHKRKS